MIPLLPIPKRINFCCSRELSAQELSKSLCVIVSFLQSVDPYVTLQRYADWWQHDGYSFKREQVDFHELFAIVGCPRNLLASMTGDDNVYIGFAPTDSSWYLRFLLDWDEEGFELIGKFDVTLQKELTERFKNEVTRDLSVNLEEEDAETYFHPVP